LESILEKDIGGYLIGPWWDKKNNNELDIIAADDFNQKLLIAEVKLNSDNISMPRLKEKSVNFVKFFPGFQVEYKGLSMADM